MSLALSKLSDTARTQDYKSLAIEKIAIFNDFRALFSKLLLRGEKERAKALVESLFPEENFYEPDETMMVGILVLNYPEDYSDAIDRNDVWSVLKLLRDDENAIGKAI